MSERISGGEAIVRAVLDHGVDTVFGLPGVQMYPVYDALKRHENKVRTISSRHEQGAAYMAYGYAKSTGKPGIFSVVPGPGVLNAGGALCTAWGTSTPVMCLTGQVPASFLGRGRGHLHELPDQLGTLRTFVKWADRIDTPQQAPARVNEAFRHMLSGRPGPVSLEMCWDIMAREGRAASVKAEGPNAPPEVDEEEIARAVKLLKQAKRPMIMVGGGAQHAGPEVLALAELLDAPVVAFRSGRGIVSELHELGANCAAGREMWADTDALIGIGSRCELQYMRWGSMMKLTDRPAAPPHLVRIDIDPLEMQRLAPHAGIVADAREGTKALTAALKKARTTKSDGRERISAAKKAADEKAAKVEPHASYLKAIRKALPDDGFLVEEICQTGFVSLFAFPVTRPRSYVTAGFQGTLGFGYPTALGVKVANPDKAVVSINGDGGFMFGVQELATAAQYRIGVVAIVFNNSSFGNVRRDQQVRYEGREIGSALDNPDFVKLAESFGVAGYRAGNADELESVLAKALAADAPAVIEVPLDLKDEVSPWPLLVADRPG